MHTNCPDRNPGGRLGALPSPPGEGLPVPRKRRDPEVHPGVLAGAAHEDLEVIVEEHGVLLAAAGAHLASFGRDLGGVEVVVGDGDGDVEVGGVPAGADVRLLLRPA